MIDMPTAGPLEPSYRRTRAAPIANRRRHCANTMATSDRNCPTKRNSPPQLRQVELKANKEVIHDINERISGIARVAYGRHSWSHRLPASESSAASSRMHRACSSSAATTSPSCAIESETPRMPTRSWAEWVAKAAELYRGLDGGAAATAVLDEHWRSPGGCFCSIGRLGKREWRKRRLLLALCRHEEAERAQARFEHANTSQASNLKASAVAAWGKASQAWSGYREQHATAHAGLPGQSEHIATLVNRARKLAKQ